MKQVLIIDESPLFRDYLRERLEEFDIKATTAVNGLDGLVKLRSLVPNVLILDYHLSRQTCKELLEEKKKDPNTAKIPVIITANKIDKNRILELVPYSIKKVFSKPIKIDAFYNTLSELLGMKLEVDDTPCIMEAHVNDNVIFIEIAQGLNREKIDLLRFKITELLEIYGIKNPRVLLMMTDMNLSFADGTNLEKLLSIITEHSQAKNRHIKVLTNDKFIKEYVKGQKNYAELEVVNSLQYALDGLLAEGSNGDADDQANMVAQKILTAESVKGKKESIQIKFETETAKAFAVEAVSDAAKGLSIAAVDDDFVITELLKSTFEAMGAHVTSYTNGADFLNGLGSKTFDLIFLDILMPEVNGFEVLRNMRALGNETPVIILSAVSQREAVIKAFQEGVKSYLIKPLKPEHIVKKTAEVLRANF